jgi:hypothetical protein
MIDLTSPLKMYSQPAYRIFAQSPPFGYNACHVLSTDINYTPHGDHPRAIDELMRGLAAGEKRIHLIETG